MNSAHPPHSRLSKWDVALLAGLVGVFTGIYALIGILRHRDFNSNLDLAIFDQAVWLLSRFETPISSIKGYNIFGDHFHPIIALFVPFYWVVADAETLIAVQGLMFALSIVPVFLFLDTRLPRRAAFLLTGAYGLFWGLQRAALFDVHEMAFAPVLIAAAILAADRARWLALYASCVLLVMVKEDVIPVVAFIGAYLFVQGERRRGLVIGATGLFCFLLVVRVVIPWFNGTGGYAYSSTYNDIASRPWMLPVALVTPHSKLMTLAWWLGPFLFLPLRSPISLILIPLVMVRLLSSSSAHWSLSFHYTAPLAPVLAMAAGDGLARLLHRVPSTVSRARMATAATAVCLLLCAVLPGRLPAWRLFDLERYEPGRVERTAPQVLARIPADASVATQAALLPHVSQRARIHVLEAGVPETDLILISTDVDPWPLDSHDAINRLVAERGELYETAYAQDAWLLLRRRP